MSKLTDYLKAKRLAREGNTTELVAPKQVVLQLPSKPTMAERMAKLRADKEVKPTPVQATQPPRKETFMEKVARMKAEKNATQLAMIPEVSKPTQPTITTDHVPTKPDTNTTGLNVAQTEAFNMAKLRKPFALLGAAGTGKTHTVVRIVEWFANYADLEEVEFRDPTGSTNDMESKLAIACVSFTNRAVNNMHSAMIRYDKDLADQLSGNYLTVHKLLEYRPVFYQELEGGELKDKMKFEPQRDALNKLPIKVLIVEEGSTLDMTLWTMLLAALPDDITIIFLGDLNQLAPVFGDSILQYAVRDLPCIELTEVYRQAQGSPVIQAAYSVLENTAPETAKVAGVGEFMHIDPKQPLGTFKFAGGFLNVLKQAFAAGKYDPMTDMVLSPFNKHECGTVAIGYDIATLLDKQAAESGNPNKIYEVIAGYTKHYLAVGDRVYVNKMEGVIEEIVHNGTYLGIPPLAASTSLTRYGVYSDAPDGECDIFAEGVIDIDALMGSNAEEERTRMGSHTIKVRLETGETAEASSAGELNSLALGYTLTTHKAQGCEYNNVFILIHQSQTVVASNEWLYTAITRAKTNCYVLANQATLDKVVLRKRIKGNTLDDKREAFILSLEDRLAKKAKRGVVETEHVWTASIKRYIAEGSSE